MSETEPGKGRSCLLYTSSDPEAAVAALLEESDVASAKFAAEYEGKVAELDGQGLIVAMTKLADISDRAGRALNYAHLRFAADTADPANGALLQICLLYTSRCV